MTHDHEHDHGGSELDEMELRARRKGSSLALTYANARLDPFPCDPFPCVLGNGGEVHLMLTHSNQKEVDHPNTPADVRREATGMIFTIETTLTPGEIARKNAIHNILTGNGKPEKYAADADHVFEASKYIGYFITTDQRILDKRKELRKVCAATIFTPSEWLKVFHAANA